MADLCKSLRAMPSSLNDACRTMDAAADQIEVLRRVLAAFVAAYEIQDADNLTDEMRDAYATASVIVGREQQP